MKGQAFAPPAPQGFQIPRDHIKAARTLHTPELVDTKHHSRKKMQATAVGTHPKMVEFTIKFVNLCAKQGIPMFAFEFYRSPERQDLLFRQRVTKARGGESPHNYGLAVDVIHATRYWDLTEKEWSVIGVIGREAARRCGVKVRWGGDWNGNGIPVGQDPKERFWDPAHWELEDWKIYREVLRNDPSLYGNFDAMDKRVK